MVAQKWQPNIYLILFTCSFYLQTFKCVVPGTSAALPIWQLSIGRRQSAEIRQRLTVACQAEMGEQQQLITAL